MTTNTTVKLLLITLVSIAMIFSSCKKDEEEPAPPAAYTPSFSATSISGNVGGVDVIEFAVVCISDNVSVTKIDVRAPDGQVYTYTGGVFVQNQQMIIPDTFIKLSGSWNFTITGAISGGTHNGEGFSSVTSVSVSGK